MISVVVPIPEVEGYAYAGFRPPEIGEMYLLPCGLNENGIGLYLTLCESAKDMVHYRHIYRKKNLRPIQESDIGKNAVLYCSKSKSKLHCQILEATKHFNGFFTVETLQKSATVMYINGGSYLIED